MDRFVCLHKGGHLYGPGGMGHREYDITPHLDIYEIGKTIGMPGFVEGRANDSGGVTYESHHFWLHFLHYKRRDDRPMNDRQVEERRHFQGALVVVNHGGGWEVWKANGLLVDALARYGDDQNGMFKLCWALIDIAREQRGAGHQEAKAEYQRAFVDGRLKKRKLPARGMVKVWIEPEAPVAPSVAQAVGATPCP